MRIAVIGAGTIGAQHARRIAGLERVEEVLIASHRAEQAERLAAVTDRGRAVTVDEVLAGAADGVVIAASTQSHAELLHRALDARMPAFTEKPVAPDIATALEIVEHSERTPGVEVQVGFQRRFDPGYRRARQAYRSGELGFVHTARAVTFDEKPPPASYVPRSGGLLKDTAIHDFDIISWVTDRRPVEVYARGSNMGERYFAEFGDVDSASCLVSYDDGMLATVSASRNSGAGHDVRLELQGSRAQLTVGLDDRVPLRTAQPEGELSWVPGEPWHLYHERFAEAFQRELAAFVEVVAGRRTSPCTPREALAAFAVAEAASISRVEGRPVRIAELMAPDAR